MQKVQSMSQPCWMETNAVTWPVAEQMVADGVLRAGLLGRCRRWCRRRGCRPRGPRGGCRGNPGTWWNFWVPTIRSTSGSWSSKAGAAVLGHAAQDAQDEARVLPLPRGQVAGLADGLLLGEVADAAGVEQQDVAVVLPADDAVAPRAQHGRDRLAVALVHLAAVGFDEDPVHASWRQSRRDPTRPAPGREDGGAVRFRCKERS